MGQHKLLLVIIILVIIALAILTFWYTVQEKTPPADTEEPAGLGAEIYSEVSNPVAGEIETPQPVVNPLDRAYKNPFE